MVLSGAMRASRPTDEPNEPTNKIAAAVGERLPAAAAAFDLSYNLFYILL